MVKDIIRNDVVLGKVRLCHFNYIEISTFLDYVFGGCEISFMIAIDFTRSNGVPTIPESLHHLSQDHMNQYLEAIKAVGDIL